MTTIDSHYRALEKMYLSAPINEYFKPAVTINQGCAEIITEIEPKFFHTAGAAHGAVYFKTLDDASFFAANSYVEDVFVLTTSFTTYITRPISEGIMRTVGKVVNQNRSQLIAEAVAYDANDREIARGNGIFVRSKICLDEKINYHR
jgi:acyl-coenzyme A thioesterase PaaI-like protein